MRLLILSIVVAIAGCSGSNYATQTQTDSSAVRVSNLLNHLRTTVPRIDVNEQNYLTFAPVTSRYSNTGTLFILDGIQVGYDLNKVMQLLDQNEFVSVEFITTRRATILYGEKGNQGALLITRINNTKI